MTAEPLLTERPLTGRIRPGGPPLSLADFRRTGGYEAAQRAVRELTPSEVVQLVKDAKLRGRGGAGFPTGTKWGFMPEDAPHPRYLVVNADEMEPGTFKDRFLMEHDPHGLIEAMQIAGYALQADVGYIYVRWAYHEAREALQRAVAEARDAGLLGPDVFGSGWGFEIHVHSGAGRYIVGEETAMLDALEGRRPIPRDKLPFPTVVGLFGQPTVVQNVETLYNVPAIVRHGVEGYLGLSRAEGEGGTKLYGASGRVRRPGLWELPLGTPLGEILETHAGGMQDGYTFRGCLPGGASTDFLTTAHRDVPMSYAGGAEAGSRLGTGAIIVLDERTCPVAMCANLERFFARESCGWCTPCRDGLGHAANLLEAIERGDGRPGDLDVLERLCRMVGPGRTYCALAPGAAEPLQSALLHFRDDFEQHLTLGRCPYREAA